MKKAVLLIIIFTLLLFGSVLHGEGNLNQETVLIGDVNGDGKINISDAILLLRHIVGIVALEDHQLIRADVDNSGEIDINDAVMILKYIVGLVDKLPPVSENVEILVLHTNDIHGRVEEGDFDGMGLDRMAAVINDIRKNTPNVLLLDAGDSIHGLPIATYNKGEGIVEIMNAMGYDAMTTGNHDFNYGQEWLLELDQMADFPIMASNVRKECGELLLPYETVDFEFDGIKISVFGLTTPDTANSSHPAYVSGLDFYDPVETAGEIVPKLKANGAHIVIALVHLHTEGVWSASALAEEVEGIDLIVAGHSHDEEGRVVNGVPIVTAHEYAKKLGEVSLIVNREDGTIEWEMGGVTKEEAKLMEEAGTISPDPQVRTIIDSIKQLFEEAMSEIIGKTAVRLVGEREVIRTGESNLGNVITDSMLYATGAQIAFMNSGGIRLSIEAGDISKGDIISVLPFGNIVVTLNVKGEDIKAILEHSVRLYPQMGGGFLQVAGISFKFDPNRPVGERIVEVMVGEKPLEPDSYYLLATNDYLAAGGDGNNMFNDLQIINEYIALDEAFIAYIRNMGEISPEVENRIVAIE